MNPHLFNLKRLLLLIGLLLNLSFAFAQSDKSVLWQISGKHINQPVYLVGTIHLFDTLQYELPEAIFDRLKTVRNVYFELDFGHLNQAELMQALWIKDSTQYLNKILDTASLTKLSQAVATSSVLKALGNKLFQLKPIYVSTFLMAGTHTPSLDMELYKKALLLKDSIGGIETLNEQLKAVDAISIIEQAKMLSTMLKQNMSQNEMLNEVMRVYVRQDIHHMIEDLSKMMPLDDSFNGELVTKRNEIMANRIDALIGTQSLMIAVGAGHLGGKDGLVNSLKNKGYTLTPIAFTFHKK
ncbi:hypothetical protein ADIARSV_0670 [Arcticibacter svalbardensis MN12-7]|uniref:TraB/GumN family protein n=1 Tax=Arcticibacter svalbardensis MN12-7 TaxID=1150600 RepID=R9GWJ5_9SPHI|nr:TraB/GumN family protein [Arcticibacter svalbardensis]EOR96157.1 hypothetical protein ADIARSV_0670 [Arcticibacter svalbardensis MN12-7]